MYRSEHTDYNALTGLLREIEEVWEKLTPEQIATLQQWAHVVCKAFACAGGEARDPHVAQELPLDFTLEELRARVSDMYYPQRLQFGWESSCPCAEIWLRVNGEPMMVEVNCWRVSENIEEGQDLIIWGSGQDELRRKVGEIFKVVLDGQNWYGPYVIRLKEA